MGPHPHRDHPLRGQAARRRESMTASPSAAKRADRLLPLPVDTQADWIAEGLGVPLALLDRVVPGLEAGQDEGELFYQCEPTAGFTVAIRSDGLRAYASHIDAACTVQQVTEAIEKHHITVEDRHVLTLAIDNADDRWRRWVRIADGLVPKPAICQRLEFLLPGQDKSISAVQLESTTEQLYEQLRSIEQGVETLLAQAPAAIPGDRLAQEHDSARGECGHDIFGRQIQPTVTSGDLRVAAGPGVCRHPDGKFEATRHGYVVFVQGVLSVLSPLWVDADWMTVWWMILDDRMQTIAPRTVQGWLASRGVTCGVMDEKVTTLCSAMDEDRLERGIYVIARGAAPVRGADYSVECVAEHAGVSGHRQPDGSLVFEPRKTLPRVAAGQHVAIRYHGTPGVPGRDVCGRELAAIDGDDKAMIAGPNVTMTPGDGQDDFYATGEGVLRVRDGQVAVVEYLIVRGDIDFDTGSLDFEGEIFVDGSVKQSFSVAAGGDLTVTGTVEPGASLSSDGDITVGHGIVGRKTSVVAGGRIRAQFAHEATLTSGRDILLENSVYQGRVRCGASVTISQSTGIHGGSIVGGETWAQDQIHSRVAGSHSGARTLLVAGLDGSSARELDKLSRNIEALSQHMQSLLGRFGLESVDVGHIRSMIRAATGPRRKLLAHQAHQLGRLVQLYQTALENRSTVTGQLSKSLETSAVQVDDTAYAGVTVRVGDQAVTLTDDAHHVRYHLNDGELEQADLGECVGVEPRTDLTASTS